MRTVLTGNGRVEVRRPRLRAVKRGADRRYKQFNIVSFYDQEQERRLVSVTRQDHRGARKLLRREAARLRIRAAAESVGLIDGAPTLRKQFESLTNCATGEAGNAPSPNAGLPMTCCNSWPTGGR